MKKHIEDGVLLLHDELKQEHLKEKETSCKYRKDKVIKCIFVYDEFIYVTMQISN